MIPAASNNALIGVLCVDDNPHVAAGMRSKFSRTDGFEWRGWLTTADQLPDRAVEEHPTIVLLDLDLPGRDPFEALAELSRRCPDVKAVIFSGHVRKELIDRAIEAGAWGYASKRDGDETLVRLLLLVVGGAFAMSPEVQSAWRE